MANHAIVTQSSPSTHRNLVSPEELLDRPTQQRSARMELLPDRPSRIPPMAPARPALPGSAVRIQPPRRSATTPTTSPIVVPRVPAPTLPLRQSAATTTSYTANVSGSRSLQVATGSSVEAEVITLSQPRPDGERVRNEYIDTPLKGGLRATSTPLHAETHIHISGSPHDHLALVSPLGSQSSKTSSTKSLPFNNTGNTPLTSPSLKRLQSTRRSLPITKQPAQFTKDTPSSGANCRRDVNCPSTATTSSTATTTSSSRMVFSSPGSQSSGGDSVICPDCDRCRCLSCRTPRPLPSKWLCGDKCLCSAESCVDYVSCLCCVKGLFYHCGSASDDDDDVHRRRYHHHHHQPTTSSSSASGGSCADAPCSCVPSHHRMARWGCLASLTLVMPCLLCYWPLQGGVKVVEMCYQKCTRHGCRCDQHQQRRPNHTSSSAAQQTGKTAVVVQPLPNSSGKRLLDI